MKRNVFLLGFCCLLFNTATAQKTQAKQPAAAATGQKLANRNDSLQYIVGAYLAHWLLNNGVPLSNPALFSRGMNDVLQGKERLVPDSILEPIIVGYQGHFQKETALIQEKRYFASLNNKPGIGMFPNGVYFSVISSGSGAIPGSNDSIFVHINAKLTNGTEVEDTYRSQPFRATTHSFFKGLNDALTMMPVGSKWKLFIPSALAYGEKGTSAIPPNSALVLEVEMVGIKPR
jgi:FKBP-type peptidyl-prolyl cis-trans isomerase FklB